MSLSRNGKNRANDSIISVLAKNDEQGKLIPIPGYYIEYQSYHGDVPQIEMKFGELRDHNKAIKEVKVLDSTTKEGLCIQYDETMHKDAKCKSIPVDTFLNNLRNRKPAKVLAGTKTPFNEETDKGKAFEYVAKNIVRQNTPRYVSGERDKDGNLQPCRDGNGKVIMFDPKQHNENDKMSVTYSHFCELNTRLKRRYLAQQLAANNNDYDINNNNNNSNENYTYKKNTSYKKPLGHIKEVLAEKDDNGVLIPLSGYCIRYQSFYGDVPTIEISKKDLVDRNKQIKEVKVLSERTSTNLYIPFQKDYHAGKEFQLVSTKVFKKNLHNQRPVKLIAGTLELFDENLHEGKPFQFISKRNLSRKHPKVLLPASENNNNNNNNNNAQVSKLGYFGQSETKQIPRATISNIFSDISKVLPPLPSEPRDRAEEPMLKKFKF